MHRRQHILQVVARIPEGKVTSYGRAAAAASCPGYARYVGKVLSELPADSSIPWHRVLNAQGKIAFKPGSERYVRQRDRLLAEGIPVINGKVCLAEYLWQL